MQKIILIAQNFNWEYLGSRPKLWAGLVLSSCGPITVLGAVFNWEWLFEYNLTDKLNSPNFFNFYWLQENFGRNVARIAMGCCGVFIVLLGLLLHFII